VLAAASAFSPAAEAQTITPVRVASTLDDNLTPILWGQQSGIFKKYGLDVSLQTFPSGAAQASALTGGAIDIGKSSMLSLINGHLRGVNFHIVSGAGIYLAEKPFTGLVVAKSSPIRTAADLDGKTISSPSLRDLGDISILAWMDQHGGDSSTLKNVELPNAAVAQALVQGRIDAAVLDNPTLYNAVSSGDVRILARSYDAIAKRFLMSAWFCTPMYAEKNPDVLRSFTKAFYESAAFTDKHHDQTVDLLARYSHIDSEVIRHMVRTETALTLQASDLQPLINVAAKYKVIDRVFPASDMLG
jgi:NitT/TauT family transport system substrate-binding protein